MAGPELKFIIGAVDNASATLAKVGKETEKLGSTTAKLNAASRLLGAGAIIAFGASSVKAYAEAEAQQVKLEEAYRKFPAIANVSIQSMRDLNSAIQAKTGSDDDELAAAEAKLAMYNLTGSQIQQLIPLVNDLAVAQGIGVTEAAQAVGKAMMGNAKALKSVGVDFKATGDKAKDFQAIYDALNSKVGGAGEAFGQSTAGQLKILQQSFSDLQEEVGAQLVPALKSLVAVARPMLSVFGGLPEPLKTTVVWLGAAGAAALVLGPRLIMLKREFQGSALAATGFGGKVGAAAALAGKAVLTIAALGAAVRAAAGDSSTNVQALADSVDVFATNGAVTGELLKAFGQNGQALSDTLQYALSPNLEQSANKVADFVFGIVGISTPTSDAKGKIEALDGALSGLVKRGDTKTAAALFAQISAQAGTLGLSAEALAAAFPGYTAAVAKAGVASSDAAGGVDELGSTAADTFDQVASLKQAADDLKASLDALGGKQISLDDAMSNLYESFAKATAGAAEFAGASTDGGKSLDLHTEAGRSAQSALEGIAKAADDAAIAQASAGKSTKEITKTQTDARTAFIAAAKAAGVTAAGAAEKLADKYGLIPGKVSTEVQIEKDKEARAKAEGVRRTVGLIPPERRVSYVSAGVQAAVDSANRVRGAVLNIPQTWTTTVTIVGQNGSNIRVPNLTAATGGYISGPGTSVSDSIPARLSNGEYVIRASAVSRLGVGLLDDLNDNGQLDTHRYSTGGRVAMRGGGAARAGLARLRRDTANLVDEQSTLAEMISSQRQTARNIGDAIRNTGGLFEAFQVGQLPNALKALADANRALNMAQTAEERSQALKDQQDAQAAVAAAQPTGGNVLAGLKSKLAGIKGFFTSIKELQKRGLPGHLIKQLVDAGPVDGQEMAKALLAATPREFGDILATDAAIAADSQAFGGLTTGALISEQRGVVNRAASAARQDAVYVSSVKLQLDGRQVADALLAYKKAMGNRPLGIS